EYEWEGGSPSVGQLFAEGKLDELLGLPQRDPSDELAQEHMDLAHSIQAMYEEAFFNLLDAAHNKYKIDNLTLSGGCAMNSVANGKVYRRSKFKNVYIQSAAGDAGGAIGAAYIVASKTGDLSQPYYMNHAYWGPGYSNDYVKSLLDSESKNLDPEHFIIKQLDDVTELCTHTAKAISEAKVVGWFQGRLEWGPRALGNRSIVCDPRRADMKDILNLKIKRRESFRPFAPSILRENVSEWFEEDDDVLFMMQVFQIREEKRKQIPAVSHVDGSGRLQTVLKSTNPRYHQLISAFKQITGIPIILNTSFNENEPVVCKPEEALACFLRTKMDILVLGNYYIERKY
ncbi:MAG: carbamoyltransferase, partial [Gammaproteobacteria bacterium]|nr:carbamoyltransferase [Gammaproteobacteria bacterium]